MILKVRNGLMPSVKPLTADAFYRRFRTYILLAWNIPPIFGLSVLVFIRMFTPDQIFTILVTPLEPAFILGSMLFAFWYFRRFVAPIRAYLNSPTPVGAHAALARMRRFPLDFWTVFLGYLLLAPASVIVSAMMFAGFEPTGVDWFRIHLVALIVSIIVGLPIFFLILDLFGRALGDATLERPHLTIRTKVFLIGALVPLLVDTTLVQYYWTRTGYFTVETFAMWLMLELLAIGGSLIFVRSFGQSLQPLQHTIEKGIQTEASAYSAPGPQSTDELGVLAEDFRALMRKLRESDENLRSLTENANDGILVCRGYRVVFANRRLASLLGYRAPELLRFALQEIVHPVDYPRVRTMHDTRLHGESHEGQHEMRFIRKDGSELPAEVTAAASLWEGQPALTLIVRDTTERKIAEEALYREKELAQVTLASIGDGVITTDIDSRVVFLNSVAEYMTGWTLEQAKGRPLIEVFNIINELTYKPAVNPVARCLREGRIVGLANHTVLVRADGREFAIEDSAAPIRNRDGDVVGVVLVFHDVSRAREMAHRLSWQATHDALTGLYNRMAFEDRLRQLLQAEGEPDHELHVLLYIDLDQFKVINDIAGHIAGDEMLKQISGLIQQQVRETDMLARLGGDEFGMVLTNCDMAHAQRVADAVHQTLDALRFQWNDRVFRVGASIGVLEFRSGQATLSELMSAADLACYAAKNAGRRRTHVYVAEDVRTQQHLSEMDWASRITEAIERDHLVLYGQAIADLNGSSPAAGLHIEVLARMQDSDGELVQPGVFLPAAERFDLMPVVDRWIITRTFSQVADCLKRRGPSAIAQCAINLSGATLGDEGLLPFIKNQLTLQRLPAGLFCFEITETAAISNFQAALHLIRELKKLGCRFALDDFGSGMSSFSYLRRLPVDYLKIDGMFIRGMANDPVNRTLVGNINDIGHLLGKHTIAEYAEDQETVIALRALGVDYAQGYGIHRPELLEKIFR
jgi:diguanylate cyclase (GGDEF)-like protein/PAS domain S-box-containing protein